MMRASVDAAQLAAALRAGVASPRSPRPILAHARIEASAEGLSVITTDLETLIETRIKADVKEHGTSCARVDMLASACIGGGSIELVDDDKGLTVKRGNRNRMRVQTLPPGEWPVPESMAWVAAEVSGVALGKAISAVAYAPDASEIRPHCRSVCVGTNYVAGCNGFRLGLANIAYQGEPLLIPAGKAGTLARLLMDGADVELGIVGASRVVSRIAAVTDAERIEVQLVRGHLPNFEALIPIAAPLGSCEVNADALKVCVMRMRSFCTRMIATKGASELVCHGVARLKDGRLWIESTSGDDRDEIDESAVAQAQGEFRFGANLSDMVRFLDAAAGERVSLARFGETGQQGDCLVMQTAGEKGSPRHLISGVRL